MIASLSLPIVPSPKVFDSLGRLDLEFALLICWSSSDKKLKWFSSWKDSIEKSPKRLVMLATNYFKLRQSSPLCNASGSVKAKRTRLGLWHLSLPWVWQMTWCCTGKTAAPYSCARTTMSSRRFSWLPLLIPKKFKVKKSKTVVSSDQVVQTSWQLTASRNCLRMNPQTSLQRTSVPLWRPHFWRRIPKRG